jgi:hypothetical protein
MRDSDCLVNERCNTMAGVCTAPQDGGAIDSGAPDAGKGDALSPDARSMDATTSDGSAHDAHGHDDGATDAGSSDAPSLDALFPDASADAGDGGGTDAASDAGPDAGICDGLDQAACAANPSCQTNFCPACNNQQIYVGCTEVGGPPPVCPAIVCPGCGLHTDELSCAQDTTCHPVYMDQIPCTCSPIGCCMQFWFCAEGPRAICQGTPTCAQPAPVCEGDYTVSFTSTCYEGCVHPTECG